MDLKKINKKNYSVTDRLKTGLLFLIILLSTTINFAAKPITDSLIKILPIVSDTAKVRVLGKLCWEYRTTDYVVALNFGREGLLLAQDLNFTDGQAQILNFMGVIYRNMGDYKAANEFYFMALEIAEKNKLNREEGYALNNIGDIFKIQGNYVKALEYTNKALEKQLRTNDFRGVAYAYVRLGEIYRLKKEFKKSADVLSRALKIRKEQKDSSGMASAYSMFAELYFDEEKFDKALEFNFTALDIQTRIKSKNAIIISLYNISNIYLKMNDKTKSFEYALKAFQYAREIGSKKYIKESSQLLAVLYAEKQNYGEAYKYQYYRMIYNDSLMDEEKIKQIGKIQSLYELDKKEKENQLLKQQQQLQKSDLERQYLISIAVGGALISSIILLLLINRGRKREHQTNILLAKQNTTIETINANLTSSINYAKRIQEAIQPLPEKIREIFPNHFIIYLPKDILSGDFYWVHKFEENIIIALADCTGHGVPGALMSMVGIQLLDDIVSKNKTLSPEIVLFKLHHEIRRIFKQDENRRHDGMDIAICNISETKKQIIFAGANRPIYIIRNNNIEIIKGDNYSIGGYYKTLDRTYKNQIIDLKNIDSLYMFSDGYSDQFNSGGQKKLSPKRFRDILLSIYKLPAEQQKNQLLSEHRNWKGEMQQIDDICIIGILF